jgi:DNA-binding MarR family transcriptional regulator
MQTERFHQFVQLIDGIHKSVSRIKLLYSPTVGVKSVHLFWLYELLAYPEGLTATALASKNNVDRSLISREIEELRGNGYIELGEGGGEKRKNYNSRIRLTERGRELASAIGSYAMAVQKAADAGVSEQELISMYQTLEKLSGNISRMAEATGIAQS